MLKGTSDWRLVVQLTLAIDPGRLTGATHANAATKVWPAYCRVTLVCQEPALKLVAAVVRLGSMVTTPSGTTRL
jgi:hypothetical protein